MQAVVAVRSIQMPGRLPEAVVTNNNMKRHWEALLTV